VELLLVIWALDEDDEELVVERLELEDVSETLLDELDDVCDTLLDVLEAETDDEELDGATVLQEKTFSLFEPPQISPRSPVQGMLQPSSGDRTLPSFNALPQ